jgi:membrane protein implicated in regulation of membrane protease activity
MKNIVSFVDKLVDASFIFAALGGVAGLIIAYTKDLPLWAYQGSMFFIVVGVTAFLIRRYYLKEQYRDMGGDECGGYIPAQTPLK